MKNLLLAALLLCNAGVWAQTKLHARWDELTASDFPAALRQSNRTCILPIGILEKHGPHSPLGTDLIHVRELVARVAKQEYAVVFPDYFYGQINEAKQQYGTFALPNNVIYPLLEATCDEIARNGFDKIVIVNGHGGNPEFLKFFMQSLLNKRHSYVVYFFNPDLNAGYSKEAAQLHKSDAANDMHAGENETSIMLYLRPDLMQMDRAASQSGANQNRLPNLPHIYTPIWWYAGYPNHYAGEGAAGTAKLGEVITGNEMKALTESLRAIKADTRTLQLQNEYYDKVEGLGKEK